MSAERRKLRGSWAVLLVAVMSSPAACWKDSSPPTASPDEAAHSSASGKAPPSAVEPPKALAAAPPNAEQSIKAPAAATANDWRPQLGDKVVAQPFEPGRYAADIHTSVKLTHGRQWFTERGRASFVLDLAAGGSARGCRGSRVRGNGSRTREQQGYRGRWRPHGQGVLVELDLDNETCAQVRAYTNLDPAPWALECVLVDPRAPSTLPGRALACRLADTIDFAYHEGRAYFLPKVLPGDWLFLGPGKGLHTTRSGDSVGLTPDPDVVVTPSPIRIENGTWASE